MSVKPYWIGTKCGIAYAGCGKLSIIIDPLIKKFCSIERTANQSVIFLRFKKHLYSFFKCIVPFSSSEVNKCPKLGQLSYATFSHHSRNRRIDFLRWRIIFLSFIGLDRSRAYAHQSKG